MSSDEATRALRVTGADELALAGWDYGGAGTPLIFLHGFGHDHHVWDEIAPAFVGSFRVLAFDLRGHGASARDPGFRYHHASIGKDLAKIVAELGAATVALVGHSTAGHACIGYAARFPEQVARLVLVDAGAELHPTGGRAGRDAGGEGRARGAESKSRGDGSFGSVSEYVAVLKRFHPGARADLLERLAACWLRPREDGRFELTLDERFWRPRTGAESVQREQRPSFDRSAWAAQGEAALWRDLGAIRCPTLVVRGARSPLLSTTTVDRMVGAVLARGRAVEIPDSGHVPMIDNPALLLAELGRFLFEAT